jgi:hypothetical protein
VVGDTLATHPIGDALPKIVPVQSRAELPSQMRTIGLDPPRPVLVIVGGASGMTETDMDRLRPLFDDGLAPLAEQRGAAVVDGGTDAGVMRLMGEARVRNAATFPLVGVTPAGKALLPGAASTGDTPLEPRHTHVVLAPVATWVAGAPWIALVASVIAGDAPSATVLIDGGEVSWDDAAASLAVGRPVIAVAGTGRVADLLAAALAGHSRHHRARSLIASGLVSAVDFSAGPAAVAAAANRALTNST